MKESLEVVTTIWHEQVLDTFLSKICNLVFEKSSEIHKLITESRQFFHMTWVLLFSGSYTRMKELCLVL